VDTKTDPKSAAVPEDTCTESKSFGTMWMTLATEKAYILMLDSETMKKTSIFNVTKNMCDGVCHKELCKTIFEFAKGSGLIKQDLKDKRDTILVSLNDSKFEEVIADDGDEEGDPEEVEEEDDPEGDEEENDHDSDAEESS
jgi:hypothetical protein